MPAVFQSLIARTRILGGTRVQWSIHPKFDQLKPWTVRVEWSHSGVLEETDWEEVTTIDAAAADYVEDTAQRIWSHSDRLYYRAVLTDGNGLEYFSPIAGVVGWLDRRDALEAREIARRECLVMRKFTGSCGLLFRRRYWGTPCTRAGCLDFDTQVAQNERCPECFGTGWIGGYYTPIEFMLEINDAAPKRVPLDPSAGLVPGEAFAARCLADPEPRERDLFWDSRTDRFWSITAPKVVTWIRSVPLICTMTMQLVQPSDVLQSLNTEV
jgi:hypothetical protein